MNSINDYKIVKGPEGVDDTGFNNKKLFLLEGLNGETSIYYGQVSKIESENDTYKAKKNLTYYPSYNLVNDDELYLGEMIKFKKQTMEDSFYISLFENIKNGIINFIWKDLAGAINSISEYLSFDDQNDFDSTMKGYVGEMCYLLYLVDNWKKYSNDKEEFYDFIRVLFMSYQKTPQNKHDFFISDCLKLEVKSTLKNDVHFLMDVNQMNKNDGNTDIIYGMVRYEFSPGSSGMKLEEIVNYIKKELQIDKKDIPNHLMLATTKDGWNNKYINTKEMDVYTLNSNLLPKFDDEQFSDCKNIKFDFDVMSFYKKKSLNRIEEVKKFKTLVKDVIYETKN